jgi:RHS repeat-associated protein
MAHRGFSVSSCVQYFRLLFRSACLASILLSPAFSRAQSPTTDVQQGLVPYGSFQHGDIDHVNLANGNVFARIPLVSYPQRGGKLKLSFSAVANNKGWRIFTNPISKQQNWVYAGYPGVNVVPDQGIVYSGQHANYTDDNGHVWTIKWTNAYTTDGAVHELLSNSYVGGVAYATDATGINSGADRDGLLYSGGSINLTTPPYSYVPGNVTDANGNEVTYASNGWTDTTGRVVPGYASTTSTAPGVSSNTTNCSAGTVSALQWNLPAYNGSTSPIKFCYANFSYQTNFGRQGVAEVGGTASLINAIVLPNLAIWKFSYDSYLGLASVTFPTGGSISYVWANDNYGMNRVVTSRTVNDRNGSHLWKYQWNVTFGQNVVTDPSNNDTVNLTTQIGGYVNQSQSYSGSYTSGTLLKTVSTQFTWQHDPLESYGLGGFAINIVPVSQTVTWANGQTSQTTTTYDPGFLYLVINFDGTMSHDNAYYGLPTKQTFSDFGSSYPILKQVATVYEWQNNSNYLTANLLNLVQTSQIQDSSGNVCAETDYTYDNASYLTASGVTTQHVAAPHSVRGNLSSTTRQLAGSSTPCVSNPSWTAVTSYSNMYDTGTVYKAIDPLNHATTFAYSGFAGAYPTTITNALNQPTINNYDFNTGLLISSEDPNLLTTSYTYDNMFRLSTVSEPDGGLQTITHQETTYPFTVTLTKKINSSQNEVTTNVFDGLGSVTQSQVPSDPQGTIYTDTTYDSLGRVATVSNPYRQGTDPTTTTGITTYGYDALSRKTSVIYPDNSVLNTAYCGGYTLVTDPTGKWRRSSVDGLGRLIEVDEPNSTTSTVNSNGCPGSGEQIWVTSYSYDNLGNLTNILQNGSHQRPFTYDSLSRLLTSQNPETGKITYTYYADGTVNTKKDARSITTTYTYDALHRELTSTYSNGDPTLSYSYDQTGCINLTTCQNIGHRTSMTDGAGSETWAYEVDKTNLRSIHQEKRTTNSSPSNITKTTTYYFNLAGNVTQLVYPTGRTVNYTYDSADRPSTAADSSNGITYATDWKTPGTGCLANAVCYTPQGSTYNMSLGQTSSFTGFNLSETFNNRLQPNEIKASSSAGNAIDITYNFVDPVSLKNAGHVYGITNNLNSSRSQSFTYDQLNRISTAKTTATTGTYCWGYQFSYDAWANLNSQAGLTGYGSCTEYTSTAAADGNNHLAGLTYDASGNTQSDGNYSYTWDGESQMKTAAGVTYAYDGDGRRAAKVGSKLYWYGSGGEILSETDASGNTQNDYIFFGGKRVAMVPATGNALYYAEDSLGSSRVIVQSTGTLCYDADFTPFGGERSYASTCAQNYKFEGKERDTETGNDDFGARSYSWRFGRWLSSDWSAVPVPVPYANLTNPQTLNLYSMVADDPESFADLDGHVEWAPFLGNGPIGNIGFATASASECESFGCAAGIAMFGSLNSEQSQNQPQNQTPQSLANQVPPEMKAAIMDALNASNAPTDDDKKGGFHEESVKSGKDASGNVVVSPSVPGPYAPPGTDPHTGFKPADPKKDEKLVTVDVFAHIHPKGNADRPFNQFPSKKDIAGALSPSAINLVVGAKDKKVYFFNASGQIGNPIKLRDFMRGPQ